MVYRLPASGAHGSACCWHVAAIEPCPSILCSSLSSTCCQASKLPGSPPAAMVTSCYTVYRPRCALDWRRRARTGPAPVIQVQHRFEGLVFLSSLQEIHVTTNLVGFVLCPPTLPISQPCFVICTQKIRRSIVKLPLPHAPAPTPSMFPARPTRRPLESRSSALA